MPAYEADLERFAGYDAQVLGISIDSVPCHTAWARSLGGLSYDLLSDFHPKGEVALPGIGPLRRTFSKV